MSITEQVARFSERTQTKPPSRLGQRFSKAEFLPEAGNTVVCHLDFDDPSHTRILDARSRMMALPGSDKFLMTPKDSLHMTVFEGVIETRRTPNAWPKAIARSAPVDDVTTDFLDRLETFAPPASFKVRVSGLYPMGLLLEGASEADKEGLQNWRKAFAEVFDFRHEEHDDYTHHMTLGYATEWLTDDEARAWEDALRSVMSDLADGVFTVPLTTPAFCEFADMTHFEERLVLNGI